MDAIILAAGSGRRVGTGRPKCLTMIGGRRLIDYQLDALAAAGVTHPVVVVGYRRDQELAALAGRARIVVNERYACTNSMYSFLLARPHCRDERRTACWRDRVRKDREPQRQRGIDLGRAEGRPNSSGARVDEKYGRDALAR